MFRTENITVKVLYAQNRSFFWERGTSLYFSFSAKVTRELWTDEQIISLQVTQWCACRPTRGTWKRAQWHLAGFPISAMSAYYIVLTCNYILHWMHSNQALANYASIILGILWYMQHRSIFQHNTVLLASIIAQLAENTLFTSLAPFKVFTVVQKLHDTQRQFFTRCWRIYSCMQP